MHNLMVNPALQREDARDVYLLSKNAEGRGDVRLKEGTMTAEDECRICKMIRMAK